MPFTITITEEDGAAAFAQLIKAADFYKNGAGAPVVAAAIAEAAAGRKSRKPAASEQPGPTPTGTQTSGDAGKTDSTSTSAAAATPVDTGAAKGPTEDEQRTEARTLLRPLLGDPDQAPKVTELIGTFGVTQLTKIPADKLAEFLVQAKVLVATVAAS